jgi:hypothetical protein
MREVDIPVVFEHFRTAGPLTIPVGPHAARRVSNRRRRIRIATVSAAVIAVIAAPVIAYGLVPRDGTPIVPSSPTPSTPPTIPSTPPTTTPTPDVEPTGVPAATALQPSDVPTGYEYAGNEIMGDWTLEFAGQFCEPPNNLGGVPSSAASWEATYQTGSGPGSMSILQRVAEYTASEAQAYVEAVRAMAQGCVHTGAGDPMTWTIVEQGFAGDDALVLKWQGAGVDNTFIVVRAGELVTQIWYKDTDTPDPVLLGQRAATRLCEGTTTC